MTHDLDAKTIASLANLNRNALNRHLTLIRTPNAEFCDSQLPPKGEIEVDASYLGGERIKGKRGRGEITPTPTDREAIRYLNATPGQIGVEEISKT